MALMALVLRGEQDPARARVLMLLGLFGAALFYGDGTDHARDLGALRRRGPRGRHARVQAVRHPDHADRRRRCCSPSRSAARRSVGALFGPIMIVWFATLGAARRDRHRCARRRCWPRSIPLYADRIPGHARRARVLFARRGGAGGHRRRGAVRGHGAFRQRTRCGSRGRARAAGAGAQLLRPGRAAHRRSGGGRESVLPAGAGVGALSARRARDRGDDHRVAGGDLRRLFDHAAGDAAGLRAAHGGPAHVEPARSARSTCPASTGRCVVGVVALVLGFGTSTSLAAAYGIAVTGTMAITTVLAFVVARADVALEPARVPRAVRRLPAGRCRVLQRELVKIVDGGWFPLAFGLGVFVLMSTWKRGRELLYPRHRGRLDSAAGFRAERLAGLHDRARDRGLHDRQPRCRAARAAAQHEALQEPARAGRAAQRGHARRAARAAGAARGGRVDQRAVPQGQGLFRLHGRRRTCRRCSSGAPSRACGST